jgi:hypothetical protein
MRAVFIMVTAVFVSTGRPVAEPVPFRISDPPQHPMTLEECRLALDGQRLNDHELQQLVDVVKYVEKQLEMNSTAKGIPIDVTLSCEEREDSQ